MNTSEKLDKIAPALAKVQAACGNLQRSGRNPHLRTSYPTLKDMWAVLRVAGPKHGVSVIQDLGSGESRVTCSTMILHSSGQWISTGYLGLPVGPKHNAQTYGSAGTYAKRYSLAAALGLAEDEHDDDGEATTEPAPAEEKPKQPPTAKAKRKKRKPPIKPDDKLRVKHFELTELIQQLQDPIDRENAQADADRAYEARDGDALAHIKGAVRAGLAVEEAQRRAAQ